VAFFVSAHQLSPVNIWIFNPFDVLPWEGKAQRYASLADSLAERGHTVVHWSSGFSHTFKTRRRVPDDFDASALAYAIELIDCPGYRSNVSVSRLLNHQLYGRRLVREGLRAVASGRRAAPDVILASMPPVEGPTAALKLKRHFACKLVVDVMDAWPDTLLQVLPGVGSWGQGVGRFVLAAYYRQLRQALRHADGICAQSQAFADFAQKHGAAGAVEVFYLGAGPAELERTEGGGRRTEDPAAAGEAKGRGIRQPPERPEVRQAKTQEAGTNHAGTGDARATAPLRLLYLGAMGRSYDLETLFDAVAKLNRESVVVTLELLGAGEKRAALEARRVPGVRFVGYLRGAALAERMRSAQLGIVPFLPGSGVALPYKAADYLSYGLPEPSSIDGELGEHLRHYGCGAIYPAQQADALAAVLLSYATDRLRLAREAEAARSCFNQCFNRARIYPGFAEWLSRV